MADERDRVPRLSPRSRMLPPRAIGPRTRQTVRRPCRELSVLAPLREMDRTLPTPEYVDPRLWPSARRSTRHVRGWRPHRAAAVLPPPGTVLLPPCARPTRRARQRLSCP